LSWYAVAGCIDITEEERQDGEGKGKGKHRAREVFLIKDIAARRGVLRTKHGRRKTKVSLSTGSIRQYGLRKEWQGV